jgi:hypothetical protein
MKVKRTICGIICILLLPVLAYASTLLFTDDSLIAPKFGVIGPSNVNGTILTYEVPILTNKLQQIPQNNRNSTIATNENISGNSMTVGSDGLPIIVYKNTNLFFVKCLDVYCSTTSSRMLDTDSVIQDEGLSVAVGSDGYPVVSYADSYNSDLKLYKCDDVNCSSGTARTLDSTGTVGYFSSITVGSDGYPIISYGGSSAGLKFYKCGNVECSSGTARTLIETPNPISDTTSIAVGSDGYPLIAYEDIDANELRLYKCDNIDCSSGTARTLDTTFILPFSLYYPSVTVGSDGYPIIAYYSLLNGLKFYRCDNLDCSSGTAAVVDSMGSVGKYNSLSLDPMGHPVISCHEDPGYLRLYVCTSNNCSTSVSRTLDSSIGDNLAYSTITIGSDGNPIIAYYDDANDQLKFYKCSNEYCIPYWTRR